MLREVPPPLWALLLLGVTYLLSLAPGLGATFSVNTRPAGMIVIAASLAFLLAPMIQFWAAKTQLLPNSETNNALVTNGVYALTRNPMYLAMTLFALGGALWMGRSVMLLAPALMFAVANWVFIPFEEAKMRRQFGDAFDAYCKRVRRWV
jgi:protein-S-isoprenylcysteine O-methyltransferase Ste14